MNEAPNLTLTVFFEGKWLTITTGEAGTKVYVNGKPLLHPDNKDVVFGYMTLSMLEATQEQIEHIHKQMADKKYTTSLPCPDLRRSFTTLEHDKLLLRRKEITDTVDARLKKLGMWPR